MIFLLTIIIVCKMQYTGFVSKNMLLEEYFELTLLIHVTLIQIIQLSLNWSVGTDQLSNNSQHTTSPFETNSGVTYTFILHSNNQCNNLTVELYADHVLVETQNTTVRLSK